MMPVFSNFPALFAPPPAAFRSCAPLPRLLLLGLLVMVGLKLALVSHEEILAQFLPHDDLWHVRAAERLVWSGSYGWDTLIHYPLFSLFIALVHFIGLPLRIGLDLVLCGAAILLSRAIWQAGYSPATAAIAAMAAMFHPASFELPNRVGAEILLAPILLGAVSATIIWWNRRTLANGKWAALHAACWWAVAWNLRKESLLLAGTLAVFATMIVLQHRRESWRALGLHLLWGVMLPAMFAAGVSTAVKVANGVRWGLFTKSILEAPGFVAAYRALQSIPPPETLPYVPVPVAVREQAYAVSPTFAELRHYLDVSNPVGWSGFSREFLAGLGLRGLDEREIAAGWFYWALHDAAVAVGKGKTPAEEDAFFQTIANEITAAQKDGRLGRRWVPVAFLEPDLGSWLPRIPSSALLVFRSAFHPAVQFRVRQDPAANDACGSIFDRQANRRSHLVMTLPSAEIMGWSVTGKGEVVSISVVSPERGEIAKIRPEGRRPDIDLSKHTAFSLRAAIAGPEEWERVVVRARDSNGHVFEARVTSLNANKVNVIPGESDQLYIGVEFLSIPSFQNPWSWNSQAVVEAFYLRVSRLAAWGLVLVPLAMFFVLVPGRAHFSVIVLLIAAAVFIRIAFFTMLDATAWNGNQPRYLYPVFPLFGALMVLLWAHFFDLILSLVRRRFALRQGNGWPNAPHHREKTEVHHPRGRS